jgi:hypothetical protein
MRLIDRVKLWLKTPIGIAVVGIAVAAIVIAYRSWSYIEWKEEVLLPSGEVLMVERTATFEYYKPMGNPGDGRKLRSTTMRIPINGKWIEWRGVEITPVLLLSEGEQ